MTLASQTFRCARVDDSVILVSFNKLFQYATSVCCIQLLCLVVLLSGTTCNLRKANLLFDSHKLCDRVLLVRVAAVVVACWM